MGTDVHVVVVGGTSSLATHAHDRVDDLERRWSRFLDTSEVSALNRRAGEFVTVSAPTLDLVRKALDAWRATGGLFDPTILGALRRAGYDRTFERVRDAVRGDVRGDLVDPRHTGAAGIEIDGDRVRLPEGVGFDPGGIGKGLAADLVARELLAAGADGVCVNLGGDVRVCGRSPAGDAWTIAVHHPSSVEPLASLGIADGAVATSTTLVRTWNVDGEVRHHLIDPRTGRPSTGRVKFVTVVAAEAWGAEFLAKSMLLQHAPDPFACLACNGAEALMVDDAGAINTSFGLRAFIGRELVS